MKMIKRQTSKKSTRALFVSGFFVALGLIAVTGVGTFLVGNAPDMKEPPAIDQIDIAKQRYLEQAAGFNEKLFRNSREISCYEGKIPSGWLEAVISTAASDVRKLATERRRDRDDELFRISNQEIYTHMTNYYLSLALKYSMSEVSDVKLVFTNFNGKKTVRKVTEDQFVLFQIVMIAAVKRAEACPHDYDYDLAEIIDQMRTKNEYFQDAKATWEVTRGNKSVGRQLQLITEKEQMIRQRQRDRRVAEGEW
ncbi:MAG: hypothetical protein F6K55_03265 [Moorea sp. SIO4A3]|nr:hypothetical protein [Moorena sp. SIO4A3]